MMSGLLLVSSAANMAWFALVQASPMREFSILEAALVVVFETTFAVPHWLMARKYNSIAIEMPYVLNDMRPPKPNCLGSSQTNVAVLALSVSLPVFAQSILAVCSTTGAELFNNLYLAAYFGSVVLMMLVCCLLIASVMRIRTCLKAEQQAVSTMSLVIHSAAYGTYFLPLFVSCLLYVSDKWNATISILYVVFSFVSQLLLCVILWELGRKEQTDELLQDDEETHLQDKVIRLFSSEDIAGSTASTSAHPT